LDLFASKDLLPLFKDLHYSAKLHHPLTAITWGKRDTKAFSSIKDFF